MRGWSLSRLDDLPRIPRVTTPFRQFSSRQWKSIVVLSVVNVECPLFQTRFQRLMKQRNIRDREEKSSSETKSTRLGKQLKKRDQILNKTTQTEKRMTQHILVFSPSFSTDNDVCQPRVVLEIDSLSDCLHDDLFDTSGVLYSSEKIFSYKYV